MNSCQFYDNFDQGPIYRTRANKGRSILKAALEYRPQK